MSDSSPDFARFLARSALVLLCGCAAVTTLVIAVDPYGLYGVVGPGRFSTVKPALNRYQEQIKQVRAVQARPNFVILGNSRAEIGLDPKASAFQAVGGQGYNLAIAGTGIGTSVRQLAQLQAAGIEPKTVIIGVEFLDFLPSATAPPVVSALPEPAPAAVPSGPVFWQFDALFSLASVKEALRTLRIQHDEEAATIDPDGFNPLKEYRAYVRNDGYAKIFAQRAQENARAFQRKSTTALNPADVKRLQALLATATAMRADVKLVIYPYHAQILALFEAAGLWPQFEAWKHVVVAVVAKAQRDHPDAKIALFDFSGFGAYNCEAVPDAGDAGASTKWYWEGGHFKKQLGDIVLARVMSAQGPALQQAAFGFKLDQASELDNVARIAAERNACAAAHPATFESARRLISG
ncbi:hypothetical protein [Massilia sp. S19_KUP03_FR1]|uniref:hypothetical protein n=1 Tax=Massilia sp. S19_KUP03_FR1 TaxID=3025503 RepID=UPI002FCDA261